MKTLPLLFILLAIAGVSSAYTAPTGAPTSNNAFGPLTVGTANDVKNGGLSVGTFNARGAAWHKQHTIVKGLIIGGTATAPTQTITFGTSTDKVSWEVSDDVEAVQSLQSNSLTGATQADVCADAQGTLIRC